MSGRGRGSGARGGLKGATWEIDHEVKLDSQPSDTFPKHPDLKKPRPLTEKEERVVRNYKAVQDSIHRGPKYTQPTKRDPNAPAKTFSEAQVNSQYGGRGKADVDPFTAVETYSMKYDPPKRTLPDVSSIKFDKRMFPEELWSTLEGNDGEQVKKHIARAMEKKKTLLNGMQNAAGGSRDADDRLKRLEEKVDAATIGKEEGEEETEDEEREEELLDDDYEDDEDGGDYNAEQYFDDGEKDEDDAADGGEEY